MRSIILIIISLFGLCPALFAGQAKTVYGYLEKLQIGKEKIPLTAKLDTGAKSASIHAIHIKKYQKSNETWISFDVPIKGKLLHFEEPLVRHVAIKSRAEEKKGKAFTERPVVLMPVTMGTQQHTIEVNLANRKNFLYPFLLGRDGIIRFSGIIDPARTFTVADTAS